MLKVASLSFAVLWLLPLYVHAKNYRCNDHIQTRPCNLQLHQVRRNVYNPASRSDSGSFRRYSPDISRLATAGSPRIIEPTFRRLGNGQGLWRGFVKGVGDIQLRLHILRRGVVESVHSIGELNLTAREGPTRFTYTSAVPAGSGWSWQVLASLPSTHG